MPSKGEYEIVYLGSNWVLAKTEDDELFDQLYDLGYERVVLMNELPDTTFEYLIGKKSVTTEDFPVGPKTEKGTFLFELNQMEIGWEGGTQYAGSPINTDGSRSLLTPQTVVDVINSIVNKRKIKHEEIKQTENGIDPTKLFSNDILNFPVETTRLGVVPYVNLDNAATTPPFIAVQEGVEDYLKTYGSVHRGAGTKSKI